MTKSKAKTLHEVDGIAKIRFLSLNRQACVKKNTLAIYEYKLYFNQCPRAKGMLL